MSLLQALEQERFDLLPGGVFNVSFVRQYCRCIGADEDRGAALLKEAVSPTVPFAETIEDRDPLLAKGPLGRLREMLADAASRHGGSVAGIVGGLALIIGGLYSYDAWRNKHDAEALREAAAPVVEAAPAPPSVVQAPPPPAARAAPIQLEVRIVETVWIRAHADGERVLEGIYQPGDKHPIEAREQVVMQVGNAGGVVLALNGRELPPLGPSGRVRRVMVTPDGMRILDPPPKKEPGAEQTPPPETAETAWSGPAER